MKDKIEVKFNINGKEYEKSIEIENGSFTNAWEIIKQSVTRDMFGEIINDFRREIK